MSQCFQTISAADVSNASASGKGLKRAIGKKIDTYKNVIFIACNYGYITTNTICFVILACKT